MAPRAIGAFLGLAAAILFVVSVASSAWWSGHPVYEGREITAKTVDVGLLGGTGCNPGGDNSCEDITDDLDDTVRLLAYGELGAIGLAVIFAFIVAIVAWRIADSRKAIAKVSALFTVIAGAGGTAFLFLGPGIRADHHVTVPIGWGAMVFGAAVGSSLLCSLIAAKVQPEPLRLKSSNVPHPLPAPEPTVMPEPKRKRLGRVSEPIDAPPPREDTSPLAPPPPPAPPRADTSPLAPPPPFEPPAEPQPRPSSIPPPRPQPPSELDSRPSRKSMPPPPSELDSRPSRKSIPPPPSELDSRRKSIPPPPSEPDSRPSRKSIPPPPSELDSRPSRKSIPPPPSELDSRPSRKSIPPPPPPSTTPSEPAPPPASPPPPPAAQPLPPASSAPSIPKPPRATPVPIPPANAPHRPMKPSVPMPGKRSSHPTLTNVVPPMPEGPRAGNEVDHITSVEIDAEAKARAEAKATAPRRRSPSDIRTGPRGIGSLREPTDVNVELPTPADPTDIGVEIPMPPSDAPAATEEMTAQPGITEQIEVPRPVEPKPAEVRKHSISTAPSSLPPPRNIDAIPAGPTPACPQCESPMTWVDEHLRFYCKACRMYF